jgi:dipeptidase E
MRIIAIGGGKLARRETLAIDRLVVELTGKRRPQALFVPTASGDEAHYCDSFERVYGRQLGCRTQVLRLLSDLSDRTLLREKILEADLVYVGGGNTLRMMKLWRRLGVDRLLRRAARDGAVMAGLSAGGICWHEWGLSDSRAYTTEGDDWDYIRVRGLGFVPHMFCPHLDAEQRHDGLAAMVRKHRTVAFACDNNAAVFYDGKTARCVTSSRKARTWLYRCARGKLQVTPFAAGANIQW